MPTDPLRLTDAYGDALLFHRLKEYEGRPKDIAHVELAGEASAVTWTLEDCERAHAWLGDTIKAAKLAESQTTLL